jgi:hypothetical protein
MPPTPKPRASHLEENINEQQQSSTPPLSQSRARRLKQKTTPITNEIPQSPKPTIIIENDDEEKESNAVNHSFISKIRENDTLARFRRATPSPNSLNQNDGILYLLTLLFYSTHFQITIFLMRVLVLVNDDVINVFLQQRMQ